MYETTPDDQTRAELFTGHLEELFTSDDVMPKGIIELSSLARELFDEVTGISHAKAIVDLSVAANPGLYYDMGYTPDEIPKLGPRP